MKKLTIFPVVFLLLGALVCPAFSATYHRTVKVGPGGGTGCGGGGCDYSELNTAIDSENSNQGSMHSNLVAYDEDIVFRLWNYIDDSPVIVSGYTTNATHTLTIEPETIPSGSTGVWSTDRWRFEQQPSQHNGSAFAFFVTQSYAYMNDLQIRVSLDHASDMQHIYLLQGDNVHVSRNYLWVNIASTTPSGYQLGTAVAKKGDSGTHYVWNTIIRGTTEAGIHTRPDRAYYPKQNPGGSIYFFSNTLAGAWWNGIAKGPAESVYGYNNIIESTYNCTTGMSGGRSNSCSCSTCAGTDSLAIQSFMFVDRDNGDLHLSTEDAGALNHGYNCHANPGNCAGADYLDDIDSAGDVRPTTGVWDIGADEI